MLARTSLIDLRNPIIEAGFYSQTILFIIHVVIISRILINHLSLSNIKRYTVREVKDYRKWR